MKLCRMCKDEWFKIAEENADCRDDWFGDVALDSECEFWAHRTLNRFISAMTKEGWRALSREETLEFLTKFKEEVAKS